MQPISKQLIGKHASVTIESLLGTVFLFGPRKILIKKTTEARQLRNPCKGGFEYLHRELASRRRQHKGKSQIWGSQRWSRVPKDSDPRKTALARTSSIYKRQTRPLVRESVPEKQDRNCQRVINICSWAPDGVGHKDLLTDRQSVAMWLRL
jgi:hypothetical protein